MEEVKQTEQEVKEEVKEAEAKVVGEESWTDYILDKVLSRKLLVFLVATLLLIFNKLDGQTWMLIGSVYIGSQSIVEIVSNWKNNKEGSA